ncbi:MAG: retention module-containing protein [Bacteroidota bacterium]
MAQAQVVAKVSSVSGEAFVRESGGKIRRLKAGDFIRENESVVAADGSQVMLKLADGRDITVHSREAIKLDAEVAAAVKPDVADSALSNHGQQGFQKIAKALTSGGNLDDLLEAPAAGIVGPGGNEGHTFVEFARIVESVDPSGTYQFSAGANRLAGDLGAGAPILGTESAITVVAPDNTNDNTPTVTGHTVLIPGSTITLTITDSAGKVQTAITTVHPDGTFSVDVPNPLADGTYSVTATGRDLAGNTGTGSDTGSVDTKPPALTADLDPASDSGIKGDHITNDTTPTISGTGEAGAKISVVMPVTGEILTTTVDANGKWSVTPTREIPNNAHGQAQVTETDSAGNSTSTTVDLNIDNTPPVISIRLDVIAGDGIVNKAESSAVAIPVTGTVSGEYHVGDTVTVTVNGKDFTTTVQAGGKFSVGVPGADLAHDADQIVDAKVVTSDAAGNTTTALAAENYTLSLNPPAIAISLDANIAGDGIVNKTESTAPAIPVTGTVSGQFNVGDTVIVTVNNKEFTTTVLAGGKFSVNVPGADLAADSDRIVDAKVSTTDVAGNTATATDTQNYTVNTTPPAIAISLDANIAGDGIVNKAESTTPAIPVTGTVSGAFNVGDTVTVTVNGKDFTTTVLAGGRFSVNVPGADLAIDPDQIVDAKVTTTDAAGNTATATDTQNYTVNTTPPAIAISLDANIAGDGIVNKAESTNPAIPVTGTVSGAFNVGDTVIVTVNGKNFTTTVLAGGKFSVNVPGADLAADPDRIVDAKVSTTDAAGNTATATDTQNYTVNTAPPAIAISLDANIAGDGIVNKAESTNPAIPVTGTISGAFNVGDTVIVTVNGKDFTTTVLAGGRFSVNVPGADLAADPDRIVDAKVSTTDAAGNTATATDTQDYRLDTDFPKATIALDANFAGDGIINLAESTATAIAVTGTVGGDVKLGDPVVVTINGHDYTTTVIQRNSTLGFRVDVAGSELVSDSDHTIDAKVTTVDAAGNQISNQTSLTYEVDREPPKPWIALDANFAGDGIINLAESTSPAIAVTGTVGGDAKLGDTVVVTINGHDYTTTVIQRNTTTLGFRVDIAGKELVDDPDHTIDAKVTSTDSAGNQATVDTSLTYTVDTTPPKPWIALDANFADDGIINLAESTAPAIAVTGTVGGDAKLGDPVVVTINGHDYATTVIQRNSTTLGFSVNVAGKELVDDPDHTIDAKVTSTDSAGNQATNNTSLTYELDLVPPKPWIALDANFAGDGIINLAESTASAIAVTGTVGGDAKLGDPVVVTINGHDYTTTVIQRNSTTLGFSVNVAGQELVADPDHTIDAKVTSTDRAGNQATNNTSLTYELDLVPPKPWIALDANFAGDGIINLAESTAPAIAVTGTVGGDAKLGDPVIVTINGHDYATSVIQRNPTTLGFSVDVAGQELVADPDHTIEARVTSTDRAGNRATMDTSLWYPVDLTPPKITLEPPSGVSVSEEGLPHGNPDTIGTPDTTDKTTASGRLTVTDDSSTVHLSLSEPQETLSSGGSAIVWTLDATGHQLVGHIGSATGEPAIIVNLTGSNGSYEYDVQLLKPIDHPDHNNEDALTFNVVIQATDVAGNNSTTNLAISVEDDSPTVTPVQVIYPHADSGIHFTLSGENTPQDHNVAPDVHVFSNSLLGLLGLDALNLINLSGNQYLAKDANNNITKLVIESGSFLSINLGGGETLTWSKELASALGLKVELIDDSGLLGSHFTLTISAIDPAHPVMDNLSINELLSTLRVNDALLNVNVLNGTTITATDAYGASDTASVGTLADLSLLNSTEPASVVSGTAGNNNLSGTDQNDVMLGGAGSDVLLGNAGNDMLHGGAGNDHLDGGAGNDLLIGGAGNDLLHGGEGRDIFSWNLNDRGTPGSPAIDTIDDFGNGLDVLRITNLLSSNGIDPAKPHNLLDYVCLEKTATGDAILHISSGGGFAGGYSSAKEDQTIILKDYGAYLTGDSEYDLRVMLDSHQLVIGDSSPSTTTDGSGQAQGSLGSFGADGGHVAEVDVGGYSYRYDAASNSISRSGSSSSVSSHSYDGTTHVLTIQTTAGETIAIDMDDGTYSYTASTPLTKEHYTAVGYTLIDNDGDTASSTLRFMGTADPVNVAPVTDIDTSNNLLGIIGLGALDLIDLSSHQAFRAFDANENLSKVEIKFQSLLNLGAYDLIASQALANELGLTLTIENDPGFLGIGLVMPSSTVTITAANGGTISNLAINELLGSVHYNQWWDVDADVLNVTSITATDSKGLSSTTTVGTLAEVNLLNSPPTAVGIQEGTANADTLNGTSGDDRLYGYAGDDILNGGDGNDLIRGGAGNDHLNGGAGNDLLMGGPGNDILIGGLGSDVFRWEFADKGSAATPARDTVWDFNTAAPSAGGDILDLRDLLQGEFHDGSDVGNLENYLHFSKSGTDTVIDIRASGAGSNVTQQIVLHDADLTHAGVLASDAQIIQNLLQNSKLITD